MGKRDHLGFFITELSREVRTTEFDEAKFKEDIINGKRNGLFQDVHKQTEINEAISLFTSAYSSILDEYSPIKIIQNRNSHVPYIATEIKALMKEKNESKYWQLTQEEMRILKRTKG